MLARAYFRCSKYYVSLELLPVEQHGKTERKVIKNVLGRKHGDWSVLLAEVSKCFSYHQCTPSCVHLLKHKNWMYWSTLFICELYVLFAKNTNVVLLLQFLGRLYGLIWCSFAFLVSPFWGYNHPNGYFATTQNSRISEAQLFRVDDASMIYLRTRLSSI